MPGAGFAAGPCLFKDTMQLAAFTDNSFILGHSAMLAERGPAPLHRVAAREEVPPREPHRGHSRHGVQGRVRRHPLQPVLQAQADPGVPGRPGHHATDPYVTVDDSLLPLEDVIEQSDILIVGAPHRQYQNVSASVEVVDVWNLLGKGTNV